MAASAATFLVRFPEFARADADLVEAKLEEAARRVDASVWGAKADDGTYYLAAHLLAVSPFGMNARLASDRGSSTYLEEYRRMQRAVSAGYRVI